MLCCLLAIWLAAAAGFTVLLSYMTNDYQKTMVEHDYGTAGYLVNHPDTNVAAAFTKDKTDSDLEAGRRILSWSSFFVTLTRKSFDKIMPAFSFQMVSYIHWMNAGGYDYSRHIHNPWLHYLVLPLMKNDVC